MELLNKDQQEILQRTRSVLSDLRVALTPANISEADKVALADSIKQLDELFLLVIAGEFNSGKSSFINALLGANLQEVGVTPTTSHIHLLKYGAEVTKRPIEAGVWVQTAPIELLRNINIVDTPGTNAIVREHEALTSEFIPRSDLVLFITSADRPFSQSESAFLEQIKQWGKKIVLIVNKIDILEESDRVKVMEFVKESADRLIGDRPRIFAVSTKLAQEAKKGNPRAWTLSGFEEVEDYIYNTLDDVGRFTLKLSNPLGVGQKLINHQLELVQSDLDSLEDDSALLDDIERQQSIYESDMQRNFKARMGEIDNILYAMEKRGNDFFDNNIKLTRIGDLIQKDKIQHTFEAEVVADTPQQIEQKVSELIDWMVTQDLRQWTAVADHLQKRQEVHATRIVGGGHAPGTLAYDRQRLVESLGKTTRQTVATYDAEREAIELADGARDAVINTGLVGIGGVGIGAGIVLATQLAWLDVTGVLAGAATLIIGLLILPNRRNNAKSQLATKLAELRTKLVQGLTVQFEREMKRSDDRIQETLTPFSRFIRAEQQKINKQRTSFTELEAHIVGLKSQLKSLESEKK